MTGIFLVKELNCGDQEKNMDINGIRPKVIAIREE